MTKLLEMELLYSRLVRSTKQPTSDWIKAFHFYNQRSGPRLSLTDPDAYVVVIDFIKHYLNAVNTEKNVDLG